MATKRSKLKSNQLTFVDTNDQEHLVLDLEKQDIITKFPLVDIRAYGAKGDGVFDDTPALQSALAKIGTKEATLLIPIPIYINADVTIPENVCLKFTKGGKLVVNLLTVTDENVGTGDGTTTTFTLANTPVLENSETIYVDGVAQNRGTDYTIDYATGTITFTNPPASGAVITADYQKQYVITINGGIEAGLWEIFSGYGKIDGNPKVDAVFPEWFGAIGDGINDDTIAIQKAIDFIPSGTIVLLNTYKVSSIKGKSNVSLDGKGKGKIIPSIRDNVIDYNSCQSFSITGLKIDCSTVSIPAAIRIYNSSNFRIAENEIYNYLEDANSQDTDAAIKVANVENGIIESNYIHDFGNTATVLIRAISLDAMSTTGQIGIRVRNNRLKNVRMAFMHAGGYDNIIEGNVCENISDNGVYVLSATKEVIITGNKFLGTDEGIVCSGERIIISNNIIEVSSYAVNLNGKVDYLIVENNIMKCATVFATRTSVTDKSGIVKLVDNLIEGNIGYALIYPALINVLHIEGNIMKVANAGGVGILVAYNTVDVCMFYNNFVGRLDPADTSIYRIYFDNIGKLFIGNNNSEGDCLRTGGDIDTSQTKFENPLYYRYDLNNFFFDSTHKKNIIWSTSAPTAGVWNQGDIVLNIFPTVDANNMILIGWVCVQSGDFSVAGGEPVFQPMYVSAVSPAV